MPSAATAPTITTRRAHASAGAWRSCHPTHRTAVTIPRKAVASPWAMEASIGELRRRRRLVGARRLPAAGLRLPAVLRRAPDEADRRAGGLRLRVGDRGRVRVAMAVTLHEPH